MRFKLYTMTVMIFACLAGGSFYALAQQPPVPAASFPEIRYEFPITPDGTQIVHDFVVRNTGGAALNIHKVKSG